MGFADLHIHSIHSYDGTSTVSAILKYAADRTDLNVLAITDHNTLSGVREAMILAPHYGLEVIPGCEVSTADGHLLALFIDRPVAAGLSLVDTARYVGAMGGLCIAAHPLARGTNSLTFETILDALQYPDVRNALVGVEVFNGGLVYTRSNTLVGLEACHFPLAHVGNSDAHILPMIGHGSTEFCGTTAQELRQELIQQTTRARKGHGLTGFNVLTSYIPRYMLRKLGWATWNSSPQAPLIYKRLSNISSQL